MCMGERQIGDWHVRQGKSPLAYKPDKVQLASEEGQRALWSYFLECHQHLISPSLCLLLFFFFSLLSSLTFLHREWGREEEQRELETGLQSLLDSADHQQLRVHVDRKEMRNRGGRQADVGSCSPIPLSSCLVPCCGPGAEASCRNGVGHPVGSRSLTLEYCAP